MGSHSNQFISGIIIFSLFFLVANNPIFSQHTHQAFDRKIQFPDIPGYQTLKCDLHQHTVLSDGHVWPSVRVWEAVKDGLDAISITDHIEYQPHKEDIPHSDRNRTYEIAQEEAKNMDTTGLIIINGVEITRSMPPGHANAIFIKDANKLIVDEPLDAFKEAKKQDAFVFWNHPHWIAQQPDGISTLTDMHLQLISNGMLHGIEIVNDITFSDEALQIALDHNLTILGTSDIHGLIDWRYNVPEGGHRPVTLVFGIEKTKEAVKDGLENQRTVVWYNNTLAGKAEYLVPLIQASLEVEDIEVEVAEPDEEVLVHTVEMTNNSDANYILVNQSDYTFHNQSDVLITEAHSTTEIQVKTREDVSAFELNFQVMNAITAPSKHPEISFTVKINKTVLQD